MTSVSEVEPNVHVIGVEGSSDDLDVPMEACFRDARFKAAHSLGSVNSVNILRLLVQARPTTTPNDLMHLASPSPSP